MKIVIVTPILYDKTSPFNHLFKDMIEAWLSAGHEITRIVACENEQDQDYKMGIESDKITYIPFVRKKAEKSNVISRYISDTLTNIKMARKIKKVTGAEVLIEDVCYCSYWSVKKAKKNKMNVIGLLQDVWPDNAVASGLIGHGGLIYKFFEFWQKKVYKKADKIICISSDMKQFIADKGVSADKISVIHNWGYTDQTVEISWEQNEFVKKYDLDRDTFYAVYAGNIGRMQNVELIIRAAEKLKGQDKIRFLIIGDGVNREQVEELAKQKELDNLTFLPMQPSTLATSVYSAASVNLIPLVEGGIKTALPSKTGVVLSCGKPVAVCVDKDSKFSELIVKNECGVAVSPTDENDLAQAILDISQGKIAFSEQKLKQTFCDNFSRSVNVEKYRECLIDEKVADNG